MVLVCGVNTPGAQKTIHPAPELFNLMLAVVAAELPMRPLALERTPDPWMVARVGLGGTEAKRRCVAIEAGHALGRLFDLDIHADGRLRSRSGMGLPPRRCLICERPAKVCAAMAMHSAAELLARIGELWCIAGRA